MNKILSILLALSLIISGFLYFRVRSLSESIGRSTDVTTISVDTTYIKGDPVVIQGEILDPVIINVIDTKSEKEILELEEQIDSLRKIINSPNHLSLLQEQRVLISDGIISGYINIELIGKLLRADLTYTPNVMNIITYRDRVRTTVLRDNYFSIGIGSSYRNKISGIYPIIKYTTSTGKTIGYRYDLLRNEHGVDITIPLRFGILGL